MLTEPGRPDLPDTQVERTEIDGVTVFWAPSSPRTVGAIQFRTGRGDEPFPLMGISHLAEHLAMFPIRQRPYEMNAFVDQLRTVFHVSGTLTELTGHLREVTHNLSNLPMERLTDESRVLRAEAHSRVPSIADHLMWLRYGAQGYGGMIIDENGLGAIDAAQLQAWTSERFTAGNAVAWLSCEPPTDLHFDLPAGTRLPTIALEPIATLALPAWAPARLPGIALGVVVPRRSASSMGLRILTERLEQRLRYELGKSYEVSLAYIPLDREVAHGSLFASCLEADASVVRGAFALVVETFVAEGPTQEELDRDVAGWMRGATDSDSIYSILDRLTFNELVAHPSDTMAEILEEMRSVTPETCRVATATAVESSILAGPLGEPLGGLWHDYPNWSSHAVAGRTYDVASKKYPWSKGGAQLVVGDTGVSWVSPEGRPITVHYADCVGVLEEGPNRRLLFGRDGFSVGVDATEWRRGAEAVARIDTSVPRRLAVPRDPEV